MLTPKPKNPQVLADGQQRALHYRYKISPVQKINAFKAKELDPQVSRIGIRSAMLGAYFSKKFDKMPQTDWIKVVWEARSSQNKCWFMNQNQVQKHHQI